MKWNELYNSDAYEIMSQIPDSSVDLVFTDPPYCNKVINKGWNDHFDLPLFWEQLRRIIKPDGTCAIYCRAPFSFQLYNSNPDWFKYEYIQEKSQAGNFALAKRMPMQVNENIHIYSPSKTLPYYNPQMVESEPYTRTCRTFSACFDMDFKKIKTRSSNKRYPRNILLANDFGFKGERGLHPTQKTECACEHIILNHTKEGDIVLDPFMGSGTVPFCAMRTGRRYIGIEQDDEYHQIAENRINAFFS